MPENEKTKRVWKALKSASHCMLASRDGEAIRARPMALYASPSAKQIYFLTDVRAHKDEELNKWPHVCVTLDEESFFCSVSGTARVSRDPVIIDDIWDKDAAAWFDGKDDPNLRLVTVSPEFAEYWDRPGAVAASIKTSFAAVTGSRPDMGENEKVTM